LVMMPTHGSCGHGENYDIYHPYYPPYPPYYSPYYSPYSSPMIYNSYSEPSPNFSNSFGEEITIGFGGTETR
jgi:hypothetical protein